MCDHFFSCFLRRPGARVDTWTVCEIRKTSASSLRLFVLDLDLEWGVGRSLWMRCVYFHDSAADSGYHRLVSCVSRGAPSAVWTRGLKAVNVLFLVITMCY